LKVVAIHQPNYLPWLGFFYKIFAADVFILLDDVPYSKGSFTARTYYRKFRGRQEKGYLSVPIKKSSLGTSISQFYIDHAQRWPQSHLNRIRGIYRGAPYFDQYFPRLQGWMALAKEWDTLADWNMFLISEIKQLLNRNTPLIRSSSMQINDRGTTYLVELIRELHGDVYLSGVGGQKYQEEDLFEEAGISLRYVDSFAQLEKYHYHQPQGQWLNGLSIIDAFLNIGAGAIVDLFRNFESQE
jgi:hypothetical protein